MMQQNVLKLEPIFITIDSKGNVKQVNLTFFDGEFFTIGREKKENYVTIEDNIVSGIHGYVFKKNGRFMYQDLKSRNGTYVETANKRVFLHMSDDFIELSEGTMIKIGNFREPNKMVLIMFTYIEHGQVLKQYPVLDKPVVIGRSSENDIVLKHPCVSRRDCSVERIGERIVIKDCQSCNGVLVNGQKVKKCQALRDKDVIQILGNQFIFCGENLYCKINTGGIAIKAKNINKWVGRNNSRKQILNNIDLDIKGNEFVAVIGGSGAGKSSLMDVLNGYDNNFNGEVSYNGISLKSNFSHLKSLVGYVPQDDIIYDNLKLRKMLYYTALIRMPDDTDRNAIEVRIDSVLESLDLKEHENTYIKKLSGGHKKRASIAVELLADPKIFFLDEPTSGLDPGTEKELMQTLRSMTRKQDRTIIMVTHTTQNLDLCDKIIFMGNGGRICFAGNVEEAKSFFGTENIINAYNLVRKNTDKWIKKFVDYRNAHFTEIYGSVGDGKSSIDTCHVSAVRQYTIITKRYIELILNDFKRFITLLIQPILISVLLMVVADDELFKIYESTKSMMFVLSCSAIWIGVFDSIQEICKERNILRREHMAGMKLSIYILSKMTVQLVLGAVQAVFLVVTFLVFTGANEKGIIFNSFYFEMIMTGWMTIVASAALGLIISAIVRTGDKAMAVAPFVLIVQLLFSGILFELKGIAEYISYFTISRWSVEAMGSIAHLNELDLRLQSEFPTLVHENEQLFEASDGHLALDWGILFFI